jgi:HEAT repeat protein
VSYGAAGLRFLDVALSDERLPRELRRHLPRTIALFPPQEAALRLQVRLLTEPDGMVRFKVIRALGRLATDNREIRLDGAVLREATGRSLSAVFRLAHWKKVLDEGAKLRPERVTRGHDLLVTLLDDKQEQVIERVFRLLDLMLRDENLKQIHRGLRSTQPKVRANSRELLENLLRPPLRAAILALVDESPVSASFATTGYYTPEALDYEQLLAALIEEPNETIRSIAAFHIGELGLVRLRPRLEALDPAHTGFFVARVVERAVALLARSEGKALAR